MKARMELISVGDSCEGDMPLGEVCEDLQPGDTITHRCNPSRGTRLV